MTKMRTIPIPLRWVLLAFLHAGLVTWIILQIFSGVERDWPMYWIYTHITAPWLIVIDLLIKGNMIPESVFYPAAKYVTSFLPNKPVVHDIDNFAFPFLLMGILPIVVYLVLIPLIYKIKKRISKTRYYTKSDSYDTDQEQ